MIKDVFVVDAAAHSYNLGEDNYAVGRYSQAVVDAFYGAHYNLSPVGYRLPREHFTRDWTVAETAKMLYVESDHDYACHHVIPINAFKDGGVSIQKAREIRARWRNRFQVYAGVDPIFPDQALDSLDEQVEELNPIGLKLYPNSYSADGVVGWHMDDPEIAFPIFERALYLGLKAVAIHKAIPLGPVPMDHYRMDDIDAAAAAFPDLQFEIVHGGFAFIEETAFQLARFSNVWVNLETTSDLAVAKPAVFERVIAGLIIHAGEGALDRLMWASGASVLHPEPPLRWFWERFQFSDEVREQEGLPEITEEIKRKILGLNYLRMHGLDAEALAKNIKSDEFAVERSKGEGKTVRDHVFERVHTMTTFSQEDVISRLHEVIDPCSAATRVPLSIVEMGMIQSVEIVSRNVVVSLRMTSPLCHALPYFQMQVERVLAGITGVDGVKCTFDHGGNWQPDNMTLGAKRKLADQREFVRSRVVKSAKAASVQHHTNQGDY